MTFQEAVASGFRNYANFMGRARRTEFWFFFLFNILAQGVAGILDAALFTFGTPLAAIVSLVLLLPNLAMAARRLHDLGRSGWWLLIALVPVVGVILLLVWYIWPGEPGPNRFGPDPRHRGAAPA